MLQAHGVFTIAAVCRASARLDIGTVPAFWANSAQKSGGVEGACTNLYIQGLDNHAAMVCPKLLQGQNQALKS